MVSVRERGTSRGKRVPKEASGRERNLCNGVILPPLSSQGGGNAVVLSYGRSVRVLSFVAASEEVNAKVICRGHTLHVCVCIFMYVWSITNSKGIDQPGKVGNPACGQLKRKHVFCSSLSPLALENLFSRDRFGSPVPCQPAHSPHPG